MYVVRVWVLHTPPLSSPSTQPCFHHSLSLLLSLPPDTHTYTHVGAPPPAPVTTHHNKAVHKTADQEPAPPSLQPAVRPGPGKKKKGEDATQVQLNGAVAAFQMLRLGWCVCVCVCV
ncbi:hypothetical protein ACJQWK_04606 [Exserohilum turcicum]